MKSLTILYDDNCGLCAKCRRWVQRQPAYFPVNFLPQGSSESIRRYPGISPGVSATAPPQELIAIDDAGGVYRGDKAWLMILYALRRYRPLAMRLARPGFHGLARRAYHLVSRNRYKLSSRLGLIGDVDLRSQLADAYEPPRCRSEPDRVQPYVHQIRGKTDADPVRGAPNPG